jgi:hypothetical protein
VLGANTWSRIVGPLLIASAGVGFLLVAGWPFALVPWAVAVGCAISAQQTDLDLGPDGLHCRRVIGSFELRWEEVAGAVARRDGLARSRLVVLDSRGRYRQTGVWRWRIPGRASGPLTDAARAINAQAAALPGVAEWDEPELPTRLGEFSRETLLQAAGLDERGAERRSDKILGLWFLALFGSAALGGGLAAIFNGLWVAYVVMAISVATFLVWASRQPRLPPQRRAVRLSWHRPKSGAPPDHGG